jgi:hypothetical protein
MFFKPFPPFHQLVGLYRMFSSVANLKCFLDLFQVVSYCRFAHVLFLTYHCSYVW